ncbi:MAG: hypothetical protein R3D80_20600 [Paracoccaceae bacterium]
MEADQLKLLGRSVAPVDTVVADAGGMALRVYLAEAGAVATVAALLEKAAVQAKTARPGSLSFCLMDPTLPGEVDIDIGDAVPLNPQIKGALKSLPGVLSVEEL